MGSRTGYHHGRVHGYSQGDGGSFVPETPFDAGERVVVRLLVGPSGAAHQASFSFRISTPYPTQGASEFPSPPAAPADYESFQTLPGIQAPILQVTMADRDPGAGDVLTTNGPGVGQNGPLIYTPQGRLVWFEGLRGEKQRRI